jgi:hypothetical protein
MRLVEDRGRLLARVRDDLVGFRLCLDELVLTLFGGSETLGDLFLALFDRIQDRRPYELHTEPDEHDHCDRLADES